MNSRYPGYDVLSKRHGLSWNEVTRRVVDARLAAPREPAFFTGPQWKTLQRLCDRIIPQPHDRPPVPVAAYVDQKMQKFGAAGTRIEPMPWDGEAWQRALDALDIEAQGAYGTVFHRLVDADADALLQRMQAGELHDMAWADVPPKLFFAKRVLMDIPEAYYSHPTAWSEIGFGGPASPRGYVRMDANRRDSWEAQEAKPGKWAQAMRENRNVR
jgi:hypothetical protein